MLTASQETNLAVIEIAKKPNRSSESITVSSEQELFLYLARTDRPRITQFIIRKISGSTNFKKRMRIIGNHINKALGHRKCKTVQLWNGEKLRTG